MGAHALRKMQDHLSDLVKEWGTSGPGGLATAAPAAELTPAAAYQLLLGQGLASSPAMEVAVNNSRIAEVEAVADGGKHLDWLRGQKEELLQSGLYSDGDPVLCALDARIAEALS